MDEIKREDGPLLFYYISSKLKSNKNAPQVKKRKKKQAFCQNWLTFTEFYRSLIKHIGKDWQSKPFCKTFKLEIMK